MFDGKELGWSASYVGEENTYLRTNTSGTLTQIPLL